MLLLLFMRLLWVLPLLLLVLLVLLHCSDLCARVHFLLLLLLPLEVNEVREGGDRDANSRSDGERRCI